MIKVRGKRKIFRCR